MVFIYQSVARYVEQEGVLQQRVVIVIELHVAWNYEMLFDKQLVNRKLTEQGYELMEISLRSKCITVTS